MRSSDPRAGSGSAQGTSSQRWLRLLHAVNRALPRSPLLIDELSAAALHLQGRRAATLAFLQYIIHHTVTTGLARSCRHGAACSCPSPDTRCWCASGGQASSLRAPVAHPWPGAGGHPCAGPPPRRRLQGRCRRLPASALALPSRALSGWAGSWGCLTRPRRQSWWVLPPRRWREPPPVVRLLLLQGAGRWHHACLPPCAVLKWRAPGGPPLSPWRAVPSCPFPDCCSCRSFLGASAGLHKLNMLLGDRRQGGYATGACWEAPEGRGEGLVRRPAPRGHQRAQGPGDKLQ